MFEKITPEEAGISSRYVTKFINTLNKRSMPMHSVLMMRGDKLFTENYWAPFNKDFCHRMYSQTKSYVSVAIGLLEEEGKLSLDDTIASYFPEKIYTDIPEVLKKQTIREMLTMTTVGMTPNAINWFADESFDDRTKFYFNAGRDDAIHSAGTGWAYDSNGSQVLSSLVEKLSGTTLFNYLNEKIFKHLGTFKTATILKTRNGDSWGDSALVCTPRDMMSFARFVMNYGTWNGKRLMNEAYLRAATSKQVDNTEHGGVYGNGYGYKIWVTEQNGFAFVGMGGQFTICLPERDLIFVCTADTQGIAHAYDLIVSNFFDIIVDNLTDSSLAESKKDLAELEALSSSLTLYSMKGAETSAKIKEYDGTVYNCLPNPMGITKFSLHFSEDGKTGEFRYTNEQGDKVLPFGINHNLFGKFPELGYSNDFGGLRTTDGFMYDDAVSAAWLQDNKIGIYVQVIDRYFGNCTIYIAFKDEHAAVFMRKTAEDFMQKYTGSITAKRAN